MQRDLSHRCYMEVPRIKKVKSACPIKSVVKQKIGEPKNLYKIRLCQIHHMADGTVIPE